MPKTTFLPAALGLIALLNPVGAAPLARAPLAEFGRVSLDISGAKKFSRFISERKTLRSLQKASAGGVLRFRPGADGNYRVVTRASGQPSDDQGAFETTVALEIWRPKRVIRVAATGEGTWRVPAVVPEIWPQNENPYEPIFRGPDAKRDRREYRRQKARRDDEKTRNQKQARDSYRQSAIHEAFTESLQKAREDAEKQLRQTLEKADE